MSRHRVRSPFWLVFRLSPSRGHHGCGTAADSHSLSHLLPATPKSPPEEMFPLSSRRSPGRTCSIKAQSPPAGKSFPCSGAQKTSTTAVRGSDAVLVVGGEYLKELPPQRRVSRTHTAACTMFFNAAIVSGRLRVFNPQSGFTHRRSAGISRSIILRAAAISVTLGMRGE